jgi:hypothetical protein
MKIKRFALIGLLSILLVSGLACGGGGGTAGCNICGTYFYEGNHSDYLEIKSDNSFYLSQTGFSYTGTWELKGETIILWLSGFPTGANGLIQGNTIIDNEGLAWTK